MRRYIILFLSLVLKTFAYAQAPVQNASSAVRDSADFDHIFVQPADLHGRVTKAKLLEKRGLYASGTSSKYNVTGYTFMYSLSDKSLGVLKISGPGFTDQVIKIILALPSGSQVFFDDIKIAASDGRTGSVKPIALVIE